MTSELKLFVIGATFSSAKHRGRTHAMVFTAAQNVFEASSAHACGGWGTNPALVGSSCEGRRKTNDEDNKDCQPNPCPAPHAWRKPLEENGVHMKPHV